MKNKFFDAIVAAFINFTTGEGSGCNYLVSNTKAYEVEAVCKQQFVEIEGVTYRLAIERVTGAVEEMVKG